MSILCAYIYNFSHTLLAAHETQTIKLDNIRMKVENIIRNVDSNVQKRYDDNDDKLTFVCECVTRQSNAFNKYNNGNIYVCVSIGTGDEVKSRILFDCIQSMKNLANPNPKTVKTVVEYHNNQQNDKISAIKNDIEIIKDEMMENVDKILDRGQKFDELNASSDALRIQSTQFHNGSTTLKRNMCMKNAKIIAMIVGGLIFIILIIVLIARK